MTTLLIIVSAFAANLPLGWRRTGYEKFTLPWWLLIHASVPFIIGLRIWMEMPLIWSPVVILAAVLGQLVGKRYAAKHRNPAKKQL